MLLKDKDLRDLAHQIVKKMPSDLLATMAVLEREGKLDHILSRVILRVMAVQVATGVISEMFRQEVEPLLSSLPRPVRWSGGFDTHSPIHTAMTVGTADVFRSKAKRVLAGSA